jgi:hypothetical protein
MVLWATRRAEAFFCGRREVTPEDVRQLLPFVLQDKLMQDSDSPFFEAPENAALGMD